jgi:molecular chaperone DnaK
VKYRAVGIDLGTTYSAVAWVDKGIHTTMVPNSEGDILTPSVVLFEDQETVVGKEAKKAAVLRVGRVAEMVKRDMGSQFYSRPIRDAFLPPEVIQACILRKLKADILKSVGPDHQVVITVPAFFDEPRRRATAQAGEMAGLALLDIVNEPTAAALAFGEELGYLNESGTPRERMHLLVYDLGGGTFDVTLVELQTGNIRTLATDGDVRLGGRDWDLRLVDYAAEAFIKEHREDPRKNPASLQRMLVEAEEAKHTLTQRSKTKIRVEHSGCISEVPVTRGIFEQVTSDLLERTAHTTRQLLNAAAMSWQDVRRILLVGGSTRMPMVERMLKELSGITPDHTVHPDEAVARGAALFAHFRLGAQGGSDPGRTFHITDVNSHSLGIEGVDPQTQRKRNVILIPRNTPLPAKIVRDFVTKSAGQSTIAIKVLEGESAVPAECTEIGKTVIRDLPSHLPQGSPVDVTYEYTTSGRLQVQAKVRALDRQASLELERDAALSEQRVKQWKRVLNASSGAAGGVANGLNAFESLIEETVKVVMVDERKPGSSVAPAAAQASPMSSGSMNRPAPTITQPAPNQASVSPPSSATSAPKWSSEVGSSTFGEDLGDILNQTAAFSQTPATSASQFPGPQPAPFPPNPSPAAAANNPFASAQQATYVVAELVPQPSDDASPAFEPGGSAPPRRRRGSGALGSFLVVAAFVLSSVFGLGIGYYVLCCVAPEQYNHFDLPIPEMFQPPPVEDGK